mmetsp:Transcript_27647/g.65652  ORF Transcript_27647/g.65652 Transcript_27647/m.65652 type:complete len:373 (-) Transcript_27647:81-1199(-)
MSTSLVKDTKCLVNSALIATFLTLNSTLNMLNRWALGIYGFRYPLVMTVCHMAFSVLVLSPYMLCTRVRGSHIETIKHGWKGIAGIGAFMAANISLNNLSLMYITLSLNQMIRASLPVMTAILAVFVESKTFYRDEFISLCLLAMGVMMTVYEGSIHGSVFGVAVCLVGLMSNALMMTFSGKILSEKMDVFRLTFYTSPVSMVILLPFLWRTELQGFQDYWTGHKNGVTGVLLAGSINAVLYNVVHYLMIQRISSTGTTVVGQVKIIGLLLLSSAFLGESSQWNGVMIAGTAIALIGFVWYSNVKLQQQSAKGDPSPISELLRQFLQGVALRFWNTPTELMMVFMLVVIVAVGIFVYSVDVSDACSLGWFQC